MPMSHSRMQSTLLSIIYFFLIIFLDTVLEIQQSSKSLITQPVDEHFYLYSLAPSYLLLSVTQLSLQDEQPDIGDDKETVTGILISRPETICVGIIKIILKGSGLEYKR